MAEANTPNVALDLLRIHSIITRGLQVATEKSQVFAREGFPNGQRGKGPMPFIVTRLLVPLVWKKQWALMRPFLLS
jgi:hypothetical protein